MQEDGRGRRRSASQAAANESSFRAANEELEAKADELGVSDGRTPYLCECEEERCTKVVQLTISEYEGVRSRPRQFLLAPGHESEDDRALIEHDRYTVVEKTGEEMSGPPARFSP